MENNTFTIEHAPVLVENNLSEQVDKPLDRDYPDKDSSYISCILSFYPTDTDLVNQGRRLARI